MTILYGVIHNKMMLTF